MIIKSNVLEVRQRGGPLPSKWTKYWCVLTRKGVAYYDSQEEQVKGKESKQTIPLEVISEVHNIKSLNGVAGFTFEIKSGETKTQHICNTSDERYAWLSAILKAKSQVNEPEEDPKVTQRAKEREAEFDAFPPDELQKYASKKLLKEYQKEADRLLSAWKDEKTLILETIKRKEIEILQASFHQQTLEIQKEIQIKKDIFKN
eukprot:TRINITY_DN26665_c0_g1_i1.p1 TRINITY_DN26665_c0_g1~~TRINITY_DN26665_c0_g1_i1.p1  ORF type:complete len:202 (-),score=57.41 TRINITY_DN26665_c0_g1_i1:130-735(-)